MVQGIIGRKIGMTQVFKDDGTVEGLKVVQADPDRNLLLVRGAVPGARNGLLTIKRSGRA